MCNATDKANILWSLARLNLRLKEHIQAKIIKKSVFLFWLLNMAIICELVHRLELQKSFKFWVAVAT